MHLPKSAPDLDRSFPALGFSTASAFRFRPGVGTLSRNFQAQVRVYSNPCVRTGETTMVQATLWRQRHGGGRLCKTEQFIEGAWSGAIAM